MHKYRMNKRFGLWFYWIIILLENLLKSFNVHGINCMHRNIDLIIFITTIQFLFVERFICHYKTAHCNKSFVWTVLLKYSKLKKKNFQFNLEFNSIHQKSWFDFCMFVHLLQRLERKSYHHWKKKRYEKITSCCIKYENVFGNLSNKSSVKVKNVLLTGFFSDS